MICQATYDSLDAIPDIAIGDGRLRDEFHQVNGKWVLKDTAVPGVGPLFNSALAANEKKAVDQVKKRNERINALEEENNGLKDRLSVLDQPGSKILSKEDSTLWERYTLLGTPKELETKLAAHSDAIQKLQKFETKEALNKITSVGDVKINPDVLSDWVNSPEGEGLKFFVKSVEQTDAKGNKVTTEVPYVSISKKEGDVVNVSEKELLPYAKETLPEWKYAALTTVPDNGQKSSDGKSVKVAAPAGGVKLPDLGSAQKQASGDGNKKRPVDIANEERASKPNPFARQSQTIPMAGAGQVR